MVSRYGAKVQHPASRFYVSGRVKHPGTNKVAPQSQGMEQDILQSEKYYIWFSFVTGIVELTRFLRNVGAWSKLV